MHVGHAGPELPETADGQPGATIEMDGALRAPSRDPGSLADVAQPLRNGLRRALDSGRLRGQHGDAATPVMGPPLYGGWHVKSHRVPPGETGWFTEANLDPRSRVAAGLATE